MRLCQSDGTEIGFGFYVLGGGNIAMFMQFGEGVTLDINNYNEYYQVGDVITFGTYEQDNNLENGAEPIEWQVLEVLLLLEQLQLQLSCKSRGERI